MLKRAERILEEGGCVPCSLTLCLPSTCACVSYRCCHILVEDTYGCGSHAVEALLALGGDVGAIGSFELDLEVRCAALLA